MESALNIPELPPRAVAKILSIVVIAYLAMMASSLAPALRSSAASETVCTCTHCPGGALCCCHCPK